MISHSLAVFQNRIIISSVQLLSHFRLCSPMDCRTPGLPVHHQLPELAQTHVHPVHNVIQPSYPLLSPSPPALNLSQHQGLFHESVFFIRWPNYWRFIFSISPSSEYSGLISFRIDWFDLLAVQGTLKSLLQHNSSKASRITIGSNNSFPRYKPKRNENLYSNSIVHTGWKVETTHLSAEQINKMYIHIISYLTVKKEQSSDTCSNMDELLTHCAEPKKPVTEDRML